MRLALDHHYPASIAPLLRGRGFDAVDSRERHWDRLTDSELLRCCSHDQRALLTNNVADVMQVVRDWQLEQVRHSGVIFTSDRHWPRTNDMTARFVDALEGLMKQRPADNALDGVIVWL